MAKTIVRDEKGELSKIARKLIKKHKEFRPLGKINILFVWRLGDKTRFDEENRPVLAQTRKLSSRERDVYGYDVEIEVYKQSWRRLGPKKKSRVMFHELMHVDVEHNEEFKVNRDDDGRIIFHIRPHDIVLTTFEKELDKWGLQGGDVATAVALAKALKKKKKQQVEAP